jgi:hypothetical protein
MAGMLYVSVYLAVLWRSGLLTEHERLAVTNRLQQWTTQVVPGYSATSPAPAVPPAPLGER